MGFTHPYDGWMPDGFLHKAMVCTPYPAGTRPSHAVATKTNPTLPPHGLPE